MDAGHREQPQTMRPATVRFGKSPRPHLVIGVDGQEVDVTAAVRGFTLTVAVDGGEVVNSVVLDLAADTEGIDWETGDVLVASALDPADNRVEVTAEEIDAVLADKGWSETTGQAVVAHLVARGATLPPS